MGEHTKEPWRAEGDEIYEKDATERPIAHILSSWFEDGPDGFLVATDARRIVACVNACAGIPTYQLTGEQDAPTDLGGIIDTLRARVAELEAKLKVAEEALSWLDRNALINSTERIKANIKEVLAKIKEAS